MPTPEDAEKTMGKFLSSSGFPNVFGCIGVAQIQINAPSDGYEYEFLNRKNNHSINVQVN